MSFRGSFVASMMENSMSNVSLTQNQYQTYDDDMPVVEDMVDGDDPDALDFENMHGEVDLVNQNLNDHKVAVSFGTGHWD